eukprot:GHVP01065061.1.p1 GENE.GHVP01065061.1~~GHVP01065061.1.p1  ORF type:complete len:244 (+),score=45.16 GHVP01065061.1:23-733(+)
MTESLAHLRHEISPLSKEQLVELLAKASLAHEDVREECAAFVRSSPACRRLMLRNIAFSTDDATFREYLATFGPFDDAAIVRERDGRSKGFGFVTFHEVEAAQQVLETTHKLDGRILMAKLASDPFSDFANGKANATAIRKLFVRNLSEDTTSEDLEEHFEKFGALTECAVVYDSAGEARGFGFVQFVEPESAVQAVQEPQRIIKDRVVFVSFASTTRTKKRRPFRLAKKQKNKET